MTIKVAQLTVDKDLQSISTWLSNTVVNSVVSIVPLNSTTLIIFYT